MEIKITKKILLFTMLLLCNVLLAHEQSVYRYLTEQSYYLLKRNLGNSIPKYEQYLSLISNGAYNEDEVDLVFKYKDYIAFDNALITISHFWDAD